jgi:hypothetical protein
MGQLFVSAPPYTEEEGEEGEMNEVRGATWQRASS